MAIGVLQTMAKWLIVFVALNFVKLIALSFMFQINTGDLHKESLTDNSATFGNIHASIKLIEWVFSKVAIQSGENPHR